MSKGGGVRLDKLRTPPGFEVDNRLHYASEVTVVQACVKKQG